jgi:hypothetical protein
MGTYRTHCPFCGAPATHGFVPATPAEHLIAGEVGKAKAHIEAGRFASALSTLAEVTPKVTYAGSRPAAVEIRELVSGNMSHFGGEGRREAQRLIDRIDEMIPGQPTAVLTPRVPSSEGGAISGRVGDVGGEIAPEITAALIRCPTCTHEVSSQAKSCPNCGHPFDVSATHTSRVAGSGWVILVGGILLTVGSFLPWFTATVFAGTFNRNGMQMGENLGFSIEGLIVLMLGIVTCVIGLGLLLRFQVPAWLQGSSIITGAGAVFVVIVSIPGINDVVSSVNQDGGDYGTASLGFGLWVAILGGLLAMGGGISAWLARRAADLTISE